ncbi:MAG: asparagine synthase (glutamine-hydrolyzing) [Rhodospirillaceae bacterium TMED167]|nr:asparagine synthase (glutamine-hydrolyzing) [Rhodospirillaceae bacterium]OUW29119.1 MAG: asparagine synthase (glutamine-hydrolyzing) [Rhodospirillaceae bacterium TMED167]
MCGVTGILHFERLEPVSADLLHRMNSTIVHRGPDGDGTYISSDGKVGLGHRRLSIIDLSEGGAQPMSNGEGTVWISFNGEIYNHVSLRAELEGRGCRFRSDHSDTEVLVQGYQAWGMRGLLDRLDGMYVFAVYDETAKRVSIARDRIGIKPVYFTKRKGVFAFASEIKALLAHPNVPATVGEAALYHYLTYLTTPAPLTLFDGIYKLPAAHFMTIEVDGSFTAERYWGAVPGQDLGAQAVAGKSAADQNLYYCQAVMERLEASVEKRMMSDAPYGAFLSGGIDSSVNVALMDRFTDDPVNTFTVGFKDHQHLNELDYAAHVAKQFKTNHHEVLVDEQDMVGYLDDLVHHQDEPLADWVCIPLHFVSKLAHDNGVKVVQVGEGSDEQFCGYNGYMKYLELNERCFRPFQKYLPRGLQNLTAATAVGLAKRFPKFEIYADAVSRASQNREPFWSGAVAFWESQKTSLLPDYFPKAPYGWEDVAGAGLLPATYMARDSFHVAEDFLVNFDQAHPGQDQLTRMIHNEFRLRLPELLLMRVDKITMASSLEARVPFLDHALVELTMDIPGAVKLRGGGAKNLLKNAVAGVIPDEIIHRKKMGFAAPMAEWLRGDFGKRAETEILGSKVLQEYGFNRDYLTSLLQDHQRQRADRSLLIWTLFNLATWHVRWCE